MSNQIIVVSDSMEALSVMEILPDAEVVAWAGRETDLSQFDGKDALIWWNREPGYRETVATLGMILLKRCRKVEELVNEEDGIGFSPSQALEMEMNQETFQAWSKTVILGHQPTVIRTITEDKPQGEFLDAPPADIHDAWIKAGLALNKNGSLVINEDNVLRVLEGVESLRGAFWMDIFSGAPMATLGGKSKQWTDSDSLLLCIDLQRKLGFTTLKQAMVHNAVMAACSRNQRHPVKEWLDPLKWDEKPRLENFFRDYFGAEDTAFNRAVSKNFFLAMLARIYEPGCKVDNMVILEGGQGKRKSSALKALVGDWFVECNETLAGNHKDFLAILHGKMIAEIAELDSFSKAETTKIKAIISTASDRYRPPYGRIAENFPRTSVFVGTTNDHAYLSDSTGGRRFWPVKTGHIDLDRLKADKNQLFAEAMINRGLHHRWWEVPEDEALARQEERRRNDPWETLIQDYLLCKDEVTSEQIIGECLKLDVKDMTQQNANRVANCMKAMGWKNHSTRRSGRPTRIWKKATE